MGSAHQRVIPKIWTTRRERHKSEQCTAPECWSWFEPGGRHQERAGQVVNLEKRGVGHVWQLVGDRVLEGDDGQLPRKEARRAARSGVSPGHRAGGCDGSATGVLLQGKQGSIVDGAVVGNGGLQREEEREPLGEVLDGLHQEDERGGDHHERGEERDAVDVRRLVARQLELEHRLGIRVALLRERGVGTREAHGGAHPLPAGERAVRDLD